MEAIVHPPSRPYAHFGPKADHGPLYRSRETHARDSVWFSDRLLRSSLLHLTDKAIGYLEVDRSRKPHAALIIAAVVGAALPAALWVRSYWAKDVVYGWLGVPGYFQFDSTQGGLKAIVNFERQGLKVKYESDLPVAPNKAWYAHLEETRFGWWLDLAVPHYFAVVLGAIVAPTIVWAWSFRFSTRSLLIATTVIATLLGVMAAMSREQ